MSWTKGQDTIEGLIADGLLQRVPASKEAAGILIAEARRHLDSAATIAEADPQGAYALTYDAARKAMAAVLEAQGLRATSRGGHIVLYDAALAQFDPPLGHLFRPFNRMRVRRNQVEYASTENPEVTPEEVRRDIEKASELVEKFAVQIIAKVLDQVTD